MVTLLIGQPGVPVRRVPLDRDRYLLGSLGLCDISIDHAEIGPEHLEIRVEDGTRLRLRSLGGGGSFRLNGTRYTRGTVHPGDVVETGPLVLLFEIPAPAAAAVDPDLRELSFGGARRIIELAEHLLAGRSGRDALVPMLDVLLEIFGAARALVLGIDERRRARVLARRGAWPPGASPRMSRTLYDRIRKDPTPILIADVLADPQTSTVESLSLEVRSMVAGPILRAGEIIGIVYLESPERAPIYGEPERAFLERFCGFAAHLLDRVSRTEDLERDKDRLLELHERTQEEVGPLGDLVGRSQAMEDVRQQILQVAPTDVTTLILGESGTGKELVARAIHRASRRAGQPFVAINCTALPADLVESELFGHVAGAFSGAIRDRRGRFELAHGGTLFLDEVGDLPQPVQAKLLRALQERVIQRVGEGADRPVDVRIVAATNAPMAEAIQAGRFREDLYYRLGVFTIRLPPLRDRPGDALELAELLVERFARSMGRPCRGFTAEARAVLASHRWPGNVRELANVMEQAVVRESGPAVTAAHLELGIGVHTGLGRTPGPGPGPGSLVAAYGENFELARSRFEIAFLKEILAGTPGEIARVLQRTGMSKATFYRRCAALGLEPGSRRSGSPDS